MESARKPWRVAFWEERALPSGVTGPVDFAELAAEARLPSSVTGPRDLAPLVREDAILRVELILAALWQAGGVVLGSGTGKWLILWGILAGNLRD
jgi:hypothetical protein